MSEYIVGIDPGTFKSGYVLCEPRCARVVECEAAISNAMLLDRLDAVKREHPGAWLAIEWVQSYGRPVGMETFETCRWVGRFEERWANGKVRLLKPRDIKTYLCGTAAAKDADRRKALIELYGETRRIAVGTKNARGPLYGVSSHAWSALSAAVALSGLFLGSVAARFGPIERSTG